ncbi:MAG: phosphomethylpyrimidine synthase ThiC [candidate division WOR-3 bacterium]
MKRKVCSLKSKRREIKPVLVGKGLPTRVNTNIGTSPEASSLKEELKKLKVAIAAGTDTVMDLSTGGDIDEIRRAILTESSVPVGTVPIYQAFYEAKKRRKSFVELTPKEILAVFEKHFRDGVDFATVHCGINRKNAEILYRKKRLTGIVSRGGALVLEWMHYQNRENPLYEYFPEIVAMAKDYGVCLSLGDGLRPGSIADATDEPQILELLVLGDLVAYCWEKGVDCLVEGPGHIPIQEIPFNVLLEKVICDEAPFYVLGPLVTDVACGYDHITSAIGGAIAGACGADFLCYVTPAEHLGLPTVEEVREGVIAARIAAHAADIAKGIKKAKDWDNQISTYRANLNFEKMVEICLDPKRAKEIFYRRKIKETGVCTMCGEYCALRRTKNLLGKKR